MSKANTTPKQLQAAARRQKMLAMRSDGATQKQVAAKFKLSLRRTRELLDEGFKLLEAATVEDAAVLRKVANDRLEELYMAHRDQALEGDPKATELVLKMFERQAKLNGLDAPVKTENQTLNWTPSQILEHADRMGLDVSKLRAPVELLESKAQEAGNHTHG